MTEGEALLEALRAGPTTVVVAGRGKATARLSANTLFLQEGSRAMALRVTALKVVEAPIPGVQLVGNLDAMRVTTRKRVGCYWTHETGPAVGVYEMYLHAPPKETTT